MNRFSNKWIDDSYFGIADDTFECTKCGAEITYEEIASQPSNSEFVCISCNSREIDRLKEL